MKNIKFYYLEHEYESLIIMIDINNRESYSIDELDLSSINKIDYPSDKVLKRLYKESNKNGFDGTWEKIKFILNEPKILETLIKTKNRSKYITSIKNNKLNNIKQESTSNEDLIERIWERFEDIPFENSLKYSGLYNELIEYLKTLSDNDSDILWKITNKMSNEEYFYFVFNKIKESNLISPIVHSDKGLILARELFL